MKPLQIDWAQFIRALITVAAMVVAFPLLCVASVAFVIALLLSRVAALVSVIIDEHTEARSREGQK
jgi:hypothetical protein|nr:MAG TPA: hypothetical protein [Caudoviricetes sp.]